MASTKPSFPVREVVAAAVAAFELNGETVHKHTEQFADGTVKVQKNALIQQYLNNQGNLVVTDRHRDAADEVIAYLQQVTIMQTLMRGKQDDFVGELAGTLAAGESVTLRNTGLIAWAPKIAADYKKKDDVREKYARFEHLSNYVGRVGEKISVKFTLLDARFVRHLECFSVFGHTDNGDLISYWARDQEKIFDNVTVMAKVKEHKLDAYHNGARVTVINYVKKAKV